MSLWDTIAGVANDIDPFASNDKKQDPDQAEADSLGMSPEEVRRRRQEKNDRAHRNYEIGNASAIGKAGERERQAGMQNVAGINAERSSAANIGGTSLGAGSIYEGDRAALIRQLQGMAAGTGPSLANEQLRQGQDRALAQAAALQSSARGLGASGGAAQLRETQGIIGQKGASDAATLRLQEQLGAIGGLGGVLNTAIGQEQALNLANAGMLNTTAGQNAAFQQQTSLANQQAANNMAQFKAQQEAQYVAMGMSREEAQQRANMDAQKLMMAGEQADQAAALQRWLAERAGEMSEKDWATLLAGGAGGLLGGLGGIMAVAGGSGASGGGA